MLYRNQNFEGLPEQAAEQTRPNRSPLDLALQALRQHYKGLLLWVAGCLAVALIYVAITPAEFAATSTILLEPRRPAVLTQSDVNQIQQNLDSPQIESQTQVIKSARLLNRVIRELDLASDPELRSPGRGLFGVIRDLLTDDLKRPPAVPAEALADKVSVRRLGQSLVLEISVRAATPEKSARLTNAVLAAYIYDQVSTKLLDMRRTGDWLQSRLDDMRNQQEAALNSLRNGFSPDVSFPAADIRVLNSATPQARKAFPNTTLIFLFATSFALITGVGAIIIGRLLDHRAWTEEDLSETITTRFIASVPRVRGANVRTDKKTRMLELAIAHPSTRFAESFRTIRNELLSRGESAPRSIGVVSSHKGEGASMVAANFAFTLAASGAPTVLLDGDLHTSALTRILAPNAKVGLAGALNGQSELELIHVRDSLEFVPSSAVGVSVHPFLFIGSPAMRDILEDLTKDRIVVVDLPALSESNDAVAVAAHLDAIIVVIETGRTRVEEVAQVIQAIEHGKGSVFGTVLNKSAQERF
jgi:succinoglycan biosynthesis transport protein ExoP